jgi:hypothetical protein
MADFKLIPLHGRKGVVRGYAKVDPEDYAELSRWRWHLLGGRHRYAARTVALGGGKTRHVLMHRQILGTPPQLQTDHKNGDKLDNRRSNLRIVKQVQNAQNLRSLRSDNTSGYRGVTWQKDAQKWKAQGKIGRRLHLIGYFDDVHEAGRAAAAWRAEHMPFSTS